MGKLQLVLVAAAMAKSSAYLFIWLEAGNLNLEVKYIPVFQT